MSGTDHDAAFHREVDDALETLDGATENILEAAEEMGRDNGWGEDVCNVVGPIIAAAVNARRTLRNALDSYERAQNDAANAEAQP